MLLADPQADQQLRGWLTYPLRSLQTVQPRDQHSSPSQQSTPAQGNEAVASELLRERSTIRWGRAMRSSLILWV